MWTKDGGELPDLDRMIVEGRELTFTSLNKTDNGTYRCEAGNHLGTSSAEYVLYVYGELKEIADMLVTVFCVATSKGEETERNLSVNHLMQLTNEEKKLQEDAFNSNNATYK